MGQRRRGGKEISQKGKNRHRPRAWRRGIAQGHRNEKVMVAEVLPAYARAEADQAEVARSAVEHRAQVRDFEECLAGFGRVSGSCALAPLPDPLLA